MICFLFTKWICGDTRQVKTLRFSSRVYLFTHESPLLPTSCNWPFVSPSPASPIPRPSVVPMCWASDRFSTDFSQLWLRCCSYCQFTEEETKAWWGSACVEKIHRQSWFIQFQNADSLRCSLMSGRVAVPHSAVLQARVPTAWPRPLFHLILFFHNLITLGTYLPFSPTKAQVMTVLQVKLTSLGRDVQNSGHLRCICRRIGVRFPSSAKWRGGSARPWVLFLFFFRTIFSSPAWSPR